MTTTLSTASNPVTLVDVVTVEPKNQPELLALLRDTVEDTLSTLRGWVSTCLIASDDMQRIVVYSQWRSIADIEAMRKDPRMAARFPRLTALASFESVIA